MTDWKELIKKENLSPDEIRQIPCRCNAVNQANIKRYMDNNWDVDSLLENLPFSLDDLMNENLWLNPVDSLQFDINYQKNIPYFEPHFSQYFDGLKFFENERIIHRILIKITPMKKILDFSNEISSRFNNETQIEYVPVNKNSGYVFDKPYPFRYTYSMGHECHYSRGVMEAILQLKGFEESGLKELFCSARFESILKYYYKELNEKLVHRGDSFILDGKIIAEKININLNTFLDDSISQQEEYSSVIRITENVDFLGHKIFKKGEIFNAPYCCYHLEWKPLSYSKRIRQIFMHSQIRPAYKKLEEQLRIAQQKTHEANQSKYLLEQEILKKDNFLSSTSHELRTPLNGIIGLIDSVLSSGAGNLSPDNLSNLNTASISAWRLSRLINDILDFSKIKENSLVLQKENISLYQVVDFVVKNLKPLIFGKPVIMKIDLSSNLPEVFADENRLQQIFFNLLGNALKFTHKGEIVVSAKVQQAELIVSIKDSGIGISKDKLESIFTIYNQGSDDIAQRYGGTGIGLSVTKQLVELHGGRIWVESEIDEGTCFFFTLPHISDDSILSENLNNVRIINNSDELEIGTYFRIPEWKFPQNGESMIITVDDEPINLKVIQNYLHGDKYLVNSLVSGGKLLEYLKEGVLPELVILDIFMPEISGYELCSEIRKMYTPYELPVLMLTASNNLEDMVNAFSLGANDYITKPISRGELMARVETHIKLKKSIEHIELSNKKLNIIDRLISFGFLVSTFILQNKISPDQENIILNKAYSYYKPLLDQIITDTESSGSSFGKDEKQDYFESVFSKLQNLGSKKKLNILSKIGEYTQRSSKEEFKEDDIEEISTNVFDFVSGLLFMENPKDSPHQPDPEILSKKYELTPKEIEVVSLVYEGYSNKEIGDLMGIAINTVKQHIYHIFDKVGVENRTHLIYKLVEKK